MRGMSIPFGAYPCNAPDTWIVVACDNEDQWQNFVNVLGQPEWAQDERFVDSIARKNNENALNQLISEWTQGFTPFQAMRILQAGGVPAGVMMNSEDLYSDMHLRSRGHIVNVNQPPWGQLAHQGLPGIPSLSKANAIGPTPWIGDDNLFVFQDIIGLSPEEIEAAVESGAIR
jgi:benzylsuccinate CoA-transferase BbsF subunit